MESSTLGKIATTGSLVNKGGHFWDLNYWFSTPAAASLASLYPLEILSTLILIIPLVILAVRLTRKTLTPPVQKFLNKIVLYLIWFGPVGWLLIFLRTQGVVLLSARFWWLVWLAVLVFTLYRLYRHYQNQLSYSIRQYQAYQLKKKYLPKKKKR